MRLLPGQVPWKPSSPSLSQSQLSIHLVSPKLRWLTDIKSLVNIFRIILTIELITLSFPKNRGKYSRARYSSLTHYLVTAFSNSGIAILIVTTAKAISIMIVGMIWSIPTFRIMILRNASAV